MDVMVRVDTVLNTEVTGVPSDDMVEVTGQIVVVSYATTVVVPPVAEGVPMLVDITEEDAPGLRRMLPDGMTGVLEV